MKTQGARLERVARTAPSRPTSGRKAGKTYRVEYKDDLNDASWTPLGPEVPASGSGLSVTDSSANHFQRYYRILLPD